MKKSLRLFVRNQVVLLLVVAFCLLIPIVLAILLRNPQYLLLWIPILCVAIPSFLLFQLANNRKSRLILDRVLELLRPPAELNPAAAAKAEVVQKKFERGFELHRKTGGNLYSDSWFVIIGESGGGKSWALARSGLDWVGVNQNENRLEPVSSPSPQGTNGMDWWFGKGVVVLDTAGELARPDENQWDFFLDLLKKGRPARPINGVLLVISAQSLRHHSLDQLRSEAAIRGQQIAKMREKLSVRFPIFVMITKSDFIPGFAEFFNTLDDSERTQILGWSQPDRFDLGYTAAMVEGAFAHLAGRCESRRLALLSNPEPVNARRRADEVQNLFLLPSHLGELKEKVRTYLDWAFQHAKTAGMGENDVFFRGIFLTSATQNWGSYLEAMRDILGTSESSLSPTNLRDRPLFFKELFLNKVFPEAGLVTDVPNAWRWATRWRFILNCVIALGGLIVLLFAWRSYRDFDRTIGQHAKLWSSVKNWSTNGHLNPTFVHLTTGDYQGEMEVPGSGSSVVELHPQLRKVAVEGIPVSWYFRPWQGSINVQKDLPTLQRHVLEASVTRPLFAAARSKLETMDASQPAPNVADLVAAVETLIRLEFSIAGPSQSTGNVADLNALYNSVCKTPAFPRAMTKVAAETYAAPAAWPGSLRSAGARLAANRPIANGLAVIFHTIKADASKLGQKFQTLSNVARAAKIFGDAENVPSTNWMEQLSQHYHSLNSSLNDWDPSGSLMLSSNYSDLERELREKLKPLETLESFLTSLPDSDFKSDLLVALESGRQTLRSLIPTNLAVVELEKFDVRDLQFTMLGTEKVRLFAARMRVYDVAREYVGFPLVQDVETDLTADQIKSLNQKLESLRSLSASNLNVGHVHQIKPFLMELDKLNLVANQLIEKGGKEALTAKLTYLGKQDQRPGLPLADRFRNLVLTVSEEGTVANQVLVAQERGQILTEGLNIESSVIALYVEKAVGNLDRSHKLSPVKNKNWRLLRMLFRDLGGSSRKVGRNFVLHLHLESINPDFVQGDYMAFQVDFSQDLPNLEQWPRLADLPNLRKAAGR